jgi:hypothetical protein
MGLGFRLHVYRLLRYLFPSVSIWWTLNTQSFPFLSFYNLNLISSSSYSSSQSALLCLPGLSTTKQTRARCHIRSV